MPSALIVFDSWYGNTRLVAEEIARGISSTGRVTTTVTSVQELNPPRMRQYDIIVIGSPNHQGAATHSVRRLLHELALERLDSKTISLFDTCSRRQSAPVTIKMRRALTHDDPSLHLASPGISVVVDGMQGPIHEGEVSKCREFGARLAGMALA